MPLAGAKVGVPPSLDNDENEDVLLGNHHHCPKCGNKAITLEIYGMAD